MLELAIGLPGSGELVLVLLVWALFLAVLVVLPLWRICAKAGFPGWLGLAGLFPPGALLLIWALALLEWPQQSKEPRDLYPGP